MAKKYGKQPENPLTAKPAASNLREPMSNENPNHGHNVKKVSLGPNTKR